MARICVLLLQHHVELLAEDLGVEQVLDPDPDPGRLVGVGRADAPPGRAELVAAQVALGDGVELLVVGHDQMGVARDPQPGAVHALALEQVDLVEQDAGVDDDAVADHRRDVVVEHAARHQLEGEGLPVHHDGVPGVVAALVADDHVHLLGKQIGQLALAFVTPLGADDHCGGHARLLFEPDRAVAQVIVDAGRPARRSKDEGRPPASGQDQPVEGLGIVGADDRRGHVDGHRRALGYLPSSRARASRSLIWRWISRLSGRAPYTGS